VDLRTLHSWAQVEFLDSSIFSILIIWLEKMEESVLEVYLVFKDIFFLDIWKTDKNKIADGEGKVDWTTKQTLVEPPPG